MENENATCPIWGDTVTRIQRWDDRNASVVEGSPRTGGDYIITEHARDLGDIGNLNPAQKAKLTTKLIEMRRMGDLVPVVTLDLIEEAKRADPLPVHVRAERLLRYLVNKPHVVGKSFQLLHPPPRNLEVLAWSESTSWNEIDFFAKYLTAMQWLDKKENGTEFYTITVPGYQYVAEQTKKKNLSQCFVAMWFDASMDSAYDEGIKKAVEDCGYTPLRIDQKPDVNKIDDEIIAEIRRSRFVVADFTHDAEKGVRGAVFYEAGFAYGLGLEVIYSCRKGLERDLNFDTRQYHHILWETPEDLRKQLRARIRARVGDYKADKFL